MGHAGMDQEAALSLLQHDNDKHQQLALKRRMQSSSRERRWTNPGMFAVAILSTAAVVILSFMTAVGVIQQAMTPPRSASGAKGKKCTTTLQHYSSRQIQCKRAADLMMI